MKRACHLIKVLFDIRGAHQKVEHQREKELEIYIIRRNL